MYKNLITQNSNSYSSLFFSVVIDQNITKNSQPNPVLQSLHDSISNKPQNLPKWSIPAQARPNSLNIENNLTQATNKKKSAMDITEMNLVLVQKFNWIVTCFVIGFFYHKFVFKIIIKSFNFL